MGSIHQNRRKQLVIVRFAPDELLDLPVVFRVNEVLTFGQLFRLAAEAKAAEKGVPLPKGYAARIEFDPARREYAVTFTPLQALISELEA